MIYGLSFMALETAKSSKCFIALLLLLFLVLKGKTQTAEEIIQKVKAKLDKVNDYEAQSLIKKSKTTTKDNGTYELEMTYGKYSDYGLADKVIFLFNTKDYKLPKGVTFDYDDGSKKEQIPDKLKNKKGKVEIIYSGY